MERTALHHVLVGAVLFGFWVVLSGKLDAVHLLMGLACAAGVTALSGGLLFTRVGEGNERRWLSFLPWGRILAYLPWLAWETFKANLAMIPLILGPSSRLAPRIVRFRAGVQSDVARSTLGSSITLTPGTLTLDVTSDGEYVVHAIDEGSAEALLAGTMQAKVARTFGEEGAS